MNGRLFALVALGTLVGLPAAAVTRVQPPWARRRALGLALAGAVFALCFHTPLGAGFASVLVVAALAVPDEPRLGHPLGELSVPLAVTSLVGVWASVPDVEPALVLAGAITPLAVVWILDRAGPGAPASVLLVGAVAWAVVVGAAGRTAPLAALACIGMVAVAPAALGWREQRLTTRAVVPIVGAHLILAVPIGRVAMRRATATAFLLGATSVALQLLVVFAVRRSISRRRPVR